MRRMIWILCSALLAGSCSHLAVAATRRAAESLDFLVVGDWGGQDTEPYYTTGERNVARAMGVTAAKIGSEFTIGLGDNFYDDGVTDVTDPRFRETFEVREPHPRRRMIHCAVHVHLYELSACMQNVFTASSLQSRWYMVCGNHDHRGNASAQVEYTKFSTRWYMPSLYYTKV